MNEFYKSNYLNKGNHLGTIYPYYSKEFPEQLFNTFEDAIKFRVSKNLRLEIDEVAIAEKSCLPYLLGDRTVIKNISRAPWFHSYTSDGWIAENLPKHGNLVPNSSDFIETLKLALVNEAKEYIGTRETVGILLSGGMDSRVVAGIVRLLQLELPNLNVVGITWGESNSRDVVYSQRICKSFGWDFNHFPITSETLYNNIHLSSSMGAEVSALHYHAMNDVAKLEGIDLILAGSYGDSVGRAEFSGRHVTKLRPILPNRLNELGLLKNRLLQGVKADILNDASISDVFSAGHYPLRKYEIEQECHYMRRMLQTCMHVIGSKIPLYQMFTSPNVFGHMWSLDPNIRGDDWYTKLLSILPGNLLEIPWARTGITYESTKGVPDNYSKRYHQYGLWLRRELKDSIVEALNGSEIRKLGVFNESSLDVLTKNWLRAKGISNNKLDEMVVWLASLSEFLKNNNIEKSNLIYDDSFSDNIQLLKGSSYGMAYILARNVFNK